MAESAVVVTLRHAWATLAGHGVKAAVMGGLAVGAWRHARMTHDVDLLVTVDPPAPDQLLRWAQEAGFRPKRLPALVEIPPHRFFQLLLTPKGMCVRARLEPLRLRPLALTHHLSFARTPISRELYD